MQTRRLNYKKGISLLLAIVMLISLFPAAALATAYTEDLYTDASVYVYEDFYVEEAEPVDTAVVVEAEATYAGIMPSSGGFSATISGEGQTVSFGSGSKIELGVRTSHATGQIINITETFNATTPYESVLVLRLENGIGLQGAPGLVAGSGPNWQFNINSIANAMLREQLTGIRWILDEEIVQNLTGNRYQPMSGTLIYTFAPNTDVVALDAIVRSDWAFSASGLPGRSHYNAITVTTFENVTGLTSATLNTLNGNDALTMLTSATELSTATLYDYALQGAPQPHLVFENHGYGRIIPRGEPWTTRARLTSTLGNHADRMLFESIEFTLRFHRDLGVQGIRLMPNSWITDGSPAHPIHSGFTLPMLSWTPPVPDPANANFELIAVTLTQPAMGGSFPLSVIEIYGEIPMDATQNTTVNTLTVLAGSVLATPLAGGVIDNRMAVNNPASIHIPHEFVNRLTIGTTSIQLSSVPSYAPIEPLGQFHLFNHFDQPLTNQAIRMLFDSPNIGVTAFNLPAGDVGIINLHVWTTTGRIIDDFSGAMPFNAGTSFTFVNFYDLLAPGEYIVEVYWELDGIVPVGRAWQGSFAPNSPFSYRGRILDRSTSRLPTRVIAGEFDPMVTDLRADNRIVENNPGTEPNDPARLRDVNQFGAWIPTNPAPVFPYNVSQNNLRVNLVGGSAFRQSFVRVRRDFPFGQAPAATQGHYVYLRAPQGQLEFNRASINATWGGVTFSEAAGNLEITMLPLSDTNGDRVYRLAFTEVVLGYWDSDSNMTRFPDLYVNFGIRALPQASTATINLREIITVVPMTPELRATTSASTLASIAPVSFTDHRVDPTTALAGPPLIQSLTIEPAPELVLWTEAQLVDNGILVGTGGQAYNWESGAGTINLAPDNGVQLRLHYLNNAGVNTNFIALIPIPKAGEMFTGVATPGLQAENFGFTLNLLGEVIAPGVTVSYSTDYTLDTNPSNFVPWSEVAGNIANIRMVRIERTAVPDGVSGYVALNFGVPTDASGNANTNYMGQTNRYGSRVWATVGGTSAFTVAAPVAIRMWNSVVFNYNYAGSDGIFLEVPVAHGGTVTVPSPVPTRTGYTFVRWTTDPENTTAYDFAQNVTVPRLNLFAEWRTNPIVSYTVGTGDGTPATFTPSPIPTPSNTHLTDSTVTVLADLTTTETTRGTEIGTWTFNGWTAPAGLTVIDGTFTMPGSDVEFTGYWTFTPAGSFNVTYSVGTGDGTPATFTPAVPSSTSHQQGETEIEVAEVLTTTETTRGTEIGTWTFNGWTAPAGLTVTDGTFTMPGNDVEFTGYWTFTPAGSFNVTYSVGTGDGTPATFSPAVPSSTSHQQGETEIEVADVLTTTETTRGTEIGTWTFNGWTAPAGLTVTDGTFTMPGSDVEFTGYWTFTPAGSFNVTYSVTGTLAPPTDSVSVADVSTLNHSAQVGTAVTVAPVLTTTANSNGGVAGTWTFNGWATTSAGVEIEDGEFDMPSNDVVFTGYWTFTPSGGGSNGGGNGGGGNGGGAEPGDPSPFSPYHNSFLIGRPSGNIYPHDNILRSEVAAVFFRLLSDETRIAEWSQTNPFPDVNLPSWFNNEVSTMTNMGIIRGMPDGTFAPNQAITRAEVAAIVARFFDETGTNVMTFTDTSGHWAEGYINQLAHLGWVQGPGDGTFRPNQLITRAEFAAIINRMLDRVPDSLDALLDGRTRWPDKTDTSAWFYLYLQEATHSTEFERLPTGDLRWTEILDHIDWSVFSRPNARPDDIMVSRGR